MLRLFRNFLCLVSVLQVGTAVQAQQAPAKAAAAPAAKSATVSATKSEKKEPITVSSKAATKPSVAKAEPAAVVTKPAKAEPAPSPPKSAKSDSAAAAPKPVKAESVPVPTKSAKTEPARSAPKSAAKAEPAAAPLKMGPAKPVKGETASKSGKGTEKVVLQKHSAPPRPGLVPPPPPDTPTVFAGDGFPPGFGIFDFNNPAALAGRRKDIASQLASAKKMLIDKEQRAKELKEKAAQFEQLFSEGVISRRELETAQKDSASAITELSDAKTQAISYQNAMSRLDDRMKPKSVASKKSAKGKIKAAAKGSVKVAGTSTTPAKTVVTTVATPSTSTNPSTPTNSSTSTSPPSTTTTPTTSTPTTDSTAQAATKATPGP